MHRQPDRRLLRRGPLDPVLLSAWISEEVGGTGHRLSFPSRPISPRSRSPPAPHPFLPAGMSGRKLLYLGETRLDHDSKFVREFDRILEEDGIEVKRVGHSVARASRGT